MRTLGLMTCCAVLLAGCSFTTASGLTECESSEDCDSNEVCTVGFCLPQPAGCGTTYGATEANAIPLGAALPLTNSEGPDESEVQALNAIKLAVDEINERQGVAGRRFTLHICDTRSEPDRAKEQADWLVKEKSVPVVFTSGSGQTISVTSVTIKAGVLVITHTATSPDIAKLSDKPQGAPAGLVWRTAPSDILQGRIIGDLLLGRIAVAGGTAPFANVQDVGIPYVNDAYGQGLFDVLLNRLNSTGKTVTSGQYPRNGDVTPAINAVVNNTPDVAVLVGFSEDNAKIVSGAAARGRTSQAWFFTDAGKDLGLFNSLGNQRALVEGAYGTAPAQARPGDPVYQLFVQRFRSAYGADPGQFSFTAHAYDSMYLVALGAAYAAGPDVNTPRAITGTLIADGLTRVTPSGSTTVPTYNLGGTSFNAAREELRAGNVINVRGASGDLDFDATGEAVSEYELWRVENGAFRTVQLITPPAD
jgi:branched-chain amino acid transport system substrate-binding protein